MAADETLQSTPIMEPSLGKRNIKSHLVNKLNRRHPGRAATRQVGEVLGHLRPGPAFVGRAGLHHSLEGVKQRSHPRRLVGYSGGD